MKITVKPKKNAKLYQIYDSGVKMAFVDDEGNTLHDPILCKDYISDIILWEEYIKLGEPDDIKLVWDSYHTRYGFNYSETTSSNKLCLLCNKPNPSDFLENSTRFFEKLDAIFNLDSNTKIYRDDDNSALIIEFDDFWKKYIYLMSFFLLCTRISLRYTKHSMEIKDFISNKDDVISSQDSVWHQYNDFDYLRKVVANGNWDMIKSGRFPELTPKWHLYQEKSMANFHDYSGIVETNLKVYEHLIEEKKEIVERTTSKRITTEIQEA